jgi:hypothetical protein
MAKGSEELVERLRIGGLRRKVAETVAGGVATAGRGRKPPKAVGNVIDDLRTIADELEDRAKGGPAKRKAAAKKAAATRKRKAAKRSAAAKKAARTRARK